MNVELLLKVKQQILTEPSRFDMAAFFWAEDTEEDYYEDFVRAFDTCGTAACIAGWAIHLSGGVPDDSACDYELLAADRLGIESKAADRLFFTENWETEDLSDYLKADGFTQKSQIAAKVIDKFVTKYETIASPNPK